MFYGDFAGGDFKENFIPTGFDSESKCNATDFALHTKAEIRPLYFQLPRSEVNMKQTRPHVPPADATLVIVMYSNFLPRRPTLSSAALTSTPSQFDRNSNWNENALGTFARVS